MTKRRKRHPKVYDPDLRCRVCRQNQVPYRLSVTLCVRCRRKTYEHGFREWMES